jgi:hypothetical protein
MKFFTPSLKNENTVSRVVCNGDRVNRVRSGFGRGLFWR